MDRVVKNAQTAQPFVTTGDGVRLAYQIDGRADAPTLVLSNSIGTSYRMWDSEVAALARHFRVVRYDFRGQGGSDVPPGAYSIDRFGRDVIELLDRLDVSRAHFLGLSLGGLVGQWLGVHVPERLDRLVLSNTAAYLGPPANWDKAIADMMSPDMDAIATVFIGNWFPRPMIERNLPVIATFRDMVRRTSPAGLAGAYALLRDTDMRRLLALVDTPTLVIAGEFDTVTSPAHGRDIAAAIPSAKLRLLPTVHMSHVEQPTLFLDAVLSFLNKP